MPFLDNKRQSESKTPETDAARIDNADLSDWGTGKSEYVHADFARQLELSRDEALAKLAAYEGRTNYLCECGGSKVAEQERDEWRKMAVVLAEQLEKVEKIMPTFDTQSLLTRFRELKKEGKCNS